MVNNQLPPFTFSTTECLQRWAFNPLKRHPMQDFGLEMVVGVCPKVGLSLEHYNIHLVKDTTVTLPSTIYAKTSITGHAGSR